ncbi:hypothetical protein ACFQL1_15175 [Halomicroarcula sp. GCM10025709]|uniref:DUF7289 family protein n=1 Tax=Haloarcula TaxID=2237 RepID=UPI0024C46AD7|nr:hypothetical protein [Halomicroarcula sp. YJ-61-S]
MTDRGASEVLSFALVFGIILTSVALVSVSGVQTLQDARDAEQLNNAERAFDVLSENMADIHQRGAPSRATEVSLRGVQLYTADNVTVNVTATDGPSGDVTVVRSLRPIVYDAGDDRRLVYEAGAVFRTQRDGGLVVQQPPVVVEPDRVLVPVVAPRSESTTSVGGSTALVRADLVETTVPVADTADSGSDTDYDDVYVTVTSPRRDYWQRALEATGLSNCVQGTDAAGDLFVRCSLGSSPERVLVPVYDIGIAIER